MSHDHKMGFNGGRLFALAWVGVYPMVTLISWLFGASCSPSRSPSEPSSSAA